MANKVRAFFYSGNERVARAIVPRLEQAGFTHVHDPAAADAVITFCTSQTALEDAYFGDGGFVQEVAEGSLLIDLSATTPGLAREINAVATVGDLIMVESPLVVEDVAAHDALARDNLSCFAAGEEDAVAAARPILDVLFSAVHEVGGPGAAQLAKAVHTLQVAAQIVSAAEAHALYRAQRRSVTGSGVSTRRADALSPCVEALLQAVHEERFDGDFTAEMLMAEVSAATLAADDVELIVPQAEAALHLLELLVVVGGADKSPAALALVYDDEEQCARHGLDWTRAEAVYGARNEDELGLGGFGEHADDYDEYDDGYDEGYGADLGLGYSAN